MGFPAKTPMRLVIAGDERQAKEIFEDLRFYDKNTMFYPAKDLLFFQADISGKSVDPPENVCGKGTFGAEGTDCGYQH